MTGQFNGRRQTGRNSINLVEFANERALFSNAEEAAEVFSSVKMDEKKYQHELQTADRHI